MSWSMYSCHIFYQHALHTMTAVARQAFQTRTAHVQFTVRAAAALPSTFLETMDKTYKMDVYKSSFSFLACDHQTKHPVKIAVTR